MKEAGEAGGRLAGVMGDERKDRKPEHVTLFEHRLSEERLLS